MKKENNYCKKDIDRSKEKKNCDTYKINDDKNFNVTFSPMNKKKNGTNDTIRKSYEEFKSLRDLNNDVSFKQRIKQLLNK